jgi:hypothetical protein
MTEWFDKKLKGCTDVDVQCTYPSGGGGGGYPLIYYFVGFD